MKIKNLLFTAFAAAVTAQAGAQTSGPAWVNDSTIMSQGYVNDVYYSMQNGTQKTEGNKNWELAFQMTLPGPTATNNAATVLANHVQGGVAVYSMHVSATSSFDSFTAADTVGKTGVSNHLYNADTTWNEGAFNFPYNFPSYGWGTYDYMNTHNVYGDSVYLVATGTAAYKLWIQEYIADPVDSIHWTFRIANLDGTNDHTVRINRNDYLNRNFAYYSISGDSTTDREPAVNSWDIVFTRYAANELLGPDGLPYPVMGILSNYGVEVAAAHAVSPDTVNYQNYAFTDATNGIGYTWKSQMGVADSNSTYFVKDLNGIYWQMVFTGYKSGLSGNAKTVFNKRQVFPITTGISSVSNVTKYFVAPNPANNNASLMIDATTATGAAQLTLTDMSGRAVLNSSVTINAGMNAFSVATSNLPAGMYVLSVTSNGIALTQKLSVAH